MAWGKKKKDKKVKVNVVPKPAAKVAPAPVAKPGAPIGPKLTPVKPVSHGKTGRDPLVNIHMLGNALVDGVTYKAGTDIQVPASVARAIGKSAVSMNTWKVMQSKGKLSNIRK